MATLKKTVKKVVATKKVNTKAAKVAETKAKRIATKAKMVATKAKTTKEKKSPTAIKAPKFKTTVKALNVTTLPKLKNFSDEIEYISACWAYFNTKYFGGKLQRPYAFRMKKDMKGKVKSYGSWMPVSRVMSFAPKLARDEKVFRTVIIHEMCHQAAIEISDDDYTVNRGHTAIWMQWMKKCKQTANAKMTPDEVERLLSNEEKEVKAHRTKVIEKAAPSRIPEYDLQYNIQGRCVKIIDKSGNERLGRLVCKMSGGKIMMTEKGYGTAYWSCGTSTFFEVTEQEKKKIMDEISDEHIQELLKMYSDKLNRMAQKRETRKMYKAAWAGLF